MKHAALLLAVSQAVLLAKSEPLPGTQVVVTPAYDDDCHSISPADSTGDASTIASMFNDTVMVWGDAPKQVSTFWRTINFGVFGNQQALSGFKVEYKNELGEVRESRMVGAATKQVCVMHLEGTRARRIDLSFHAPSNLFGKGFVNELSLFSNASSSSLITTCGAASVDPRLTKRSIVLQEGEYLVGFKGLFQNQIGGKNAGCIAALKASVNDHPVETPAPTPQPTSRSPTPEPCRHWAKSVCSKHPHCRWIKRTNHCTRV